MLGINTFEGFFSWSFKVLLNIKMKLRLKCWVLTLSRGFACEYSSYEHFGFSSYS